MKMKNRKRFLDTDVATPSEIQPINSSLNLIIHPRSRRTASKVKKRVYLFLFLVFLFLALNALSFSFSDFLGKRKNFLIETSSHAAVSQIKHHRRSEFSCPSHAELANKNVLVTGAAGFIGFHVIQKLQNLTAHVVGIDTFNSYYDPYLKGYTIRWGFRGAFCTRKHHGFNNKNHIHFSF
jgi:hypothetical protein